MLKKVSHIIVALLLLVSTIGMAVSTHYCGGKLVSVSFFKKAETCCNMAGCCKNENHFYKVKDDFSSSAVTTVPLQAELDILGEQLWSAELFLASEKEDENPIIYNSPPPSTVLEFLAQEQLYLL